MSVEGRAGTRAGIREAVVEAEAVPGAAAAGQHTMSLSWHHRHRLAFRQLAGSCTQEQAVQEKKKAGEANAAMSNSAEAGTEGTDGASKPEEGSPFACLHATMWVGDLPHGACAASRPGGDRREARELQVPSPAHVLCMCFAMSANFIVYAA